MFSEVAGSLLHLGGAIYLALGGPSGDPQAGPSLGSHGQGDTGVPAGEATPALAVAMRKDRRQPSPCPDNSMPPEGTEASALLELPLSAYPVHQC